MKAFALLYSLLCTAALLSCANPSSSDKKEEADSLCYGTVCVYFTYAIADSAGTRILRLEVTLRNISKQTLALDSDEYATYVKIYRDTTGELPLVWVAPESVKPDSVTPTVILAPDSSCRYRTTWPRLDYYNRPVGRGDYIIKGSILGFRAQDLEYREL